MDLSELVAAVYNILNKLFIVSFPFYCGNEGRDGPETTKAAEMRLQV